jgi:hypothetical protein
MTEAWRQSDTFASDCALALGSPEFADLWNIVYLVVLRTVRAEFSADRLLP